MCNVQCNTTLSHHRSVRHCIVRLFGCCGAVASVVSKLPWNVPGSLPGSSRCRGRNCTRIMIKELQLSFQLQFMCDLCRCRWKRFSTSRCSLNFSGQWTPTRSFASEQPSSPPHQRSTTRLFTLCYAVQHGRVDRLHPRARLPITSRVNLGPYTVYH